VGGRYTGPGHVSRTVRPVETGGGSAARQELETTVAYTHEDRRQPGTKVQKAVDILQPTKSRSVLAKYTYNILHTSMPVY